MSQLTYEWLNKGHFFLETEEFILAIQDNVIAFRNYRKYIIKGNTDTDACRKFHQDRETIAHITGGCTLMAGTEYNDIHKTASKIIHQEQLRLSKRYP